MPDHTLGDLTPALRKALVELGTIIPTTPEEVELAEAHLADEATPAEVQAAFEKLERQLAADESETLAIRLAKPFSAAADSGRKLDAETLAKTDVDVATAAKKPLRE
jgi:phage-related tail fiber protein